MNWRSGAPCCDSRGAAVSGRVTMPPTQRFGWPLRHCAQLPQNPDRHATTWSPGFTLVTSAPTASTTPAPSWPSTIGRSSGKRPWPSTTCRSLWQTPVAAVRTSTSRPHGLSISTDSTASGSWTFRKTAAWVFMLISSRLHAGLRGRRRVLGHHFGREQLDRAHRLRVAEIAPLERADEVVGAGGDVLVHVLTDGVRRTGQRHTTEPVGMWPRPLLIEALELGVDVAARLARGQARRAIADEAERAILGRLELREPALLGLEPARRGQVPAILLPRRLGRLHRLVVRFGHDEMHHQPDHRLLALDRQRAGALMLFPRGAVARHGDGEAIDRADDDRVHAFHRRSDRIAHVPERRIGLLQRPQVHRQVLEAVEATRVGQAVVAEALADDGERLDVARVVRLGVRLLAPEIRFHHAAAAHADLQPAVAQVVEHADLFDQAERMVERQHVDARAEAQAPRALGHRTQEHVL